MYSKFLSFARPYIEMGWKVASDRLLFDPACRYCTHVHDQSIYEFCLLQFPNSYYYWSMLCL